MATLDLVKSRFWYQQSHGETYKRAEEIGAALGWWDILNAGVRTPDDWRPPKYRLVGGNIWPDWMSSWAPLWSERAVRIFEPLVRDTCQYIPWVSEAGGTYSLVNVIPTIPRAEWHCEDSSSYGDDYASANGIWITSKTLPHIFRLEKYSGKTFVSDELARLSVESGLKGAAFVHPLIHETASFFIERRFGRKGTGFVTSGSSITDSRFQS
jgi:hypothetical protein